MPLYLQVEAFRRSSLNFPVPPPLSPIATIVVIFLVIFLSPFRSTLFPCSSTYYCYFRIYLILYTQIYLLLLLIKLIIFLFLKFKCKCYYYSSSASNLSTDKNASCGTSTLPICFIFFLPFFCFSRSFFFLVISPP